MSVRQATHDGVRHVVIDDLGSGSIIVEPGPGSDRVESAISADDERYLDQVLLRQDHDQLRLSFPSHLQRDTAWELRLGVPDGLSYVIRTGSADVSISAAIARSKIVSGSGDLVIARAADLDCQSGSGDVAVARLEGSAARLGSGSGDLTIGEVHCPVSAKSGSGDVTLRSVHRSEVRANSGSGDIAVASTSGSVDLRSASGTLTVGVADGLPAWLDLGSASGDISFTLESTSQPEPGEPYISVRARTASGDITVHRA